MVTQAKRLEPQAPGPVVWITCPDPTLVFALKKALEEKVRVHNGHDEEPPAREPPSSVVLCPNREDVAPEVERLRALAPDVPILVFGADADPGLAREALRAGANGFIHARMRPEQISLAFSLASEGEVVIPRELLGELVGQRLFLKLPQLLGS